MKKKHIFDVRTFGLFILILATSESSINASQEGKNNGASSCVINEEKSAPAWLVQRARGIFEGYIFALSQNDGATFATAKKYLEKREKRVISGILSILQTGDWNNSAFRQLKQEINGHQKLKKVFASQAVHESLVEIAKRRF